jgi:hypothetical protein
VGNFVIEKGDGLDRRRRRVLIKRKIKNEKSFWVLVVK